MNKQNIKLTFEVDAERLLQFAKKITSNKTLQKHALRH